jgi:hypothetical protein
VQKLIDEEAKCPDICFGSVYVVDEAFGAHVDWAANGNIFETGSSFDGEAEISDFKNALFDKNIG